MDWFIAAVILFIIEVLTPGVFFFSCLGLGAVAAGIASLFLDNHIFTWGVFAAVSIISIYTIRPLMKKIFRPRRPSNVDALIGKKAIVIERITPEQMGLVKVENELWKAESADVAEPQSFAEVLRIEGTHLVVRKVEG